MPPLCHPFHKFGSGIAGTSVTVFIVPVTSPRWMDELNNDSIIC